MVRHDTDTVDTRTGRAKNKMHQFPFTTRDQMVSVSDAASASNQTSISSSAASASAPLARISNPNPLQSHHRPILVGYAFGPKKMSTMSVVMAEASMAVSTVVTQFPPHLRSNAHTTKKAGVKRKLRQQTPASSSSEDTTTTTTTTTSGSISAVTVTSAQHTSGAASSSSCWSRNQSPMRHGHGYGRQHPIRDENANANANLNEGCDQESLSERGQNDDISIGRTSSRNDLEIETQSFVSMGSGAYTEDKDLPCANRKITCIFPSSFFLSSSSASLEESSLITATTITTSTSTSASSSVAAKSQSTHVNNSSTVPSTNGYLPQHLQPMRVSFVPLDLDSPLEEQHGGKFDAILHKMTEDILLKSQLSLYNNDDYGSGGSGGSGSGMEHNVDDTDRQALRRIERLVKYREDHPACCLVDHPTNVQALMSRAAIANTLSECLKGVTTKSHIPVRTPRFQVLRTTSDDATVAKHIDDASLQYPLIVKPLTAAGTKSSHRMGVLLGRHGLDKVNGPCLLQEYANHDELLYKVYVLGSKVWVFQRPSLPNLPVGESSQNEKTNGFVEFDSQRPYPTLENFGISSNTSKHISEKKRNEDPLTVAEIRPVADAIRKAFGLELFGFDILVTKGHSHSGVNPTQRGRKDQNEMLVVDVNYFPSYKEVTNFSQLLAQYLAQCGIEGRFAQF